jgi:hypothetical protein
MKFIGLKVSEYKGTKYLNVTTDENTSFGLMVQQGGESLELEPAIVAMKAIGPKCYTLMELVWNKAHTRQFVSLNLTDKHITL